MGGLSARGDVAAGTHDCPKDDHDQAPPEVDIDAIAAPKICRAKEAVEQEDQANEADGCADDQGDGHAVGIARTLHALNILLGLLRL